VEEKIHIVLDGLRGEETIAELCRREGIAPISGLAMATGNIGAKVDALLQRHVPTPFPQPSGADEAAKIIAG
jgi:hypothetical protein